MGSLSFELLYRVTIFWSTALKLQVTTQWSRILTPISEGVIFQAKIKISFFSGVKITGNRVFQLGEVIQIMCATPFPVPSMLWTSVNESSIEVNRGSAIQRLSLALIISPSSHNTWYKCAANDSEGFYIAETINIQVGGNSEINIVFSYSRLQLNVNYHKKKIFR